MELGRRIWTYGCNGEFGCSCPEKQAANIRRLKNLRGHGSRGKYNSGCRCPTCRKANTAYQRDYMRRRNAAARD